MAKDFRRLAVVKGLEKVSQSGFSNLVLPSLLEEGNLQEKDKNFVTAVFYGTLEHKITLDYILQKYISKPLSKLDRDVLAVLESGLYQILYMNSVPEFAAINQAVGICPVLKKTSAKGLVNAVLRKAAKFDIEKAKFQSETERVSVTYSVNPDIAEIVMRDYRNDYDKIFAAMFRPPKLTININETVVSTENLKKLFDEKGVKYLDTELENSLELKTGGSVTALPGFKEGYFFVQGVTSRYRVKSAGIKPGDDILDLCAAPGGKSFARSILLNNTGSVTSCDPNDSRLALINSGADRLNLKNIKTLKNLGQIYREDLAEKDIVICDVPCSGIGIIPKKPDLRYKDMSDTDSLVKLQYEILSTGARYLKKGGRIVYSTCTINKDENERQIDKFISANENFRLVKQNCPVAGAKNIGEKVTFLPGFTEYDGFFVAVLEKVW